MVTVTVETGVPHTTINYGNEIKGYTTETTDVTGVMSFEWSLFDGSLFVSAQKTDSVFPTKPMLKPEFWSWGRSSDWVRVVNPFTPVKFYGIRRLDVLVEALLEEAEIAKRIAEEETAKLKEQVEAEAEKLRERAEEVCVKFVTTAACSVPYRLSANFPVVIRNAKWTCEDTDEFENVTGNAKVRIEGYEFEVPIQNGFGQTNIGATPAFGELLRKLVG